MIQAVTRRQARARTPAARRRADIERRAERILLTEPHYMYHVSFDAPGAQAEILGPSLASLLDRNGESTRARPSKDADFYVAFLYRTDPLSREEEFVLFQRMNYLKFRAYRLRQGLDPKTATRRQVEEIESLEAEAVALRNYIVESNLRLVTSRAKQFSRTTGLPLDELISEGNIGLVQAVEHFDVGRGTKLSTYATWAITNKLLAYLHRARRQAGRVTAEPGEVLDGYEGESVAAEEVVFRAEIREAIGTLLGRLKERERVALENRFGLTPTGETATLKDLAGQWGVTKQRAQQVCAGAVVKLRSMLLDAGFVPCTD